SVKPSHYDLTIQTDLDNSVFKGLVKINLDVKEPTSTIVLNSSKLKLNKAISYVRSETLNEKLAPSNCSVNDKDKQVTFTFPTTFQSGTQLELEIAFTGTFDSSNVGYYRASYEKDGKKRYYTLNQFEAINARCAFPCWDEPALKATFDVTLIFKTDMVNISNSAVVLEKAFSPNDQDYLDLKEAFPTLNDKWKITKFHRTPKMSTYIVAFASGPFEYIESKVKLPISGMEVPLRVYGTLTMNMILSSLLSTADIIHQAQFALDFKAQVLPLYEQLFDVPYPLPKLDTLVVS
ncbi:leukotriene A4 hydrolase N-terminal domain-containing protein, partial [Dendrothele bispora CBS 962.96]